MIRFRWPDVRFTLAAGDPLSEAFPKPADIVKPRPTTCALLDEGDSAWPGEGVLGLSVTHILMRCTELSKLLQEEVRYPHGPTTVAALT